MDLGCLAACRNNRLDPLLLFASQIAPAAPNTHEPANSLFLPSTISFLYDGVRLFYCRFLDTNPAWALRGTNQGLSFLNETSTIEICHTLSTLTKDRDSSVGIATRYGLDGPGIECRWWRYFAHLSRAAVGPASLLYNGHRVIPGGKAAGACR